MLAQQSEIEKKFNKINIEKDPLNLAILMHYFLSVKIISVVGGRKWGISRSQIVVG